MSQPSTHPDRPDSTFGIITTSPQMEELLGQVRKVARTEAPVLVRGETGTGKELVARMLHRLSRRADGPFRAVNCAMLTGELLASELFGHVKGAFTGAIRDRKGLFELADGGTIFLDEIAEIPLDIQARLLRVLQEQAFVPVGGSEPIQVDVRIVSATHQSLRRAVAERRFRSDLMFRIRVVPLFIPRLAERTGDVEALAEHFVAEFNARPHSRTVEGIDDEAMDAMLRYEWPGNVRELRNVVEYAFAIGDAPLIGLDDLTPELRGEPPPDGLDEEVQTAEELEHRQLIEALRRTGGNRTRAAELLDISRTTLWRKLREHGIA